MTSICPFTGNNQDQSEVGLWRHRIVVSQYYTTSMNICGLMCGLGGVLLTPGENFISTAYLESWSCVQSLF